MTLQVCDRCGADITKKESAALNAIPDADTEHSGTVEISLDLCPPCYRAFKAWLVGWLKAKATTRAERKAGKRR